MAEEIDFPDQVKLFKYFTNHGYKILCETSKIFEKLILKRIMEIQKDISLDPTSKQQHGFKK